jgi:RNA polymerase primary sigma factor
VARLVWAIGGEISYLSFIYYLSMARLVRAIGGEVFLQILKKSVLYSIRNMNKRKVYSDTVAFKAYSKELNHYAIMTKAKEKQIVEKYNDPNTTDDEKQHLKDMLVEGHLKFALQIANGFAGCGVELDDIIADANMGLIKAVNSFDWNRNIKFITHASYHVRGEILNSLNNNARVIRLPMNVMHKLNKEVKALNNNGIEMSGDMANLPSTIDLHRTIGEDSSLVDVIKNTNASIPDADLEYESNVNYLLSKLDKRSAKVISLLFGLQGKQLEIKEIADELDIHKETVRLIKNKALEKLEKKLKLI